MFAEAAAAFASRTLVEGEGRRLGYGEALALGRSLAEGLPRARSLVMLKCRLTPATLAAYLALMADGHVPLLVEADLAPELADALARRYRVDAILDPEADPPLARTGHAPVPLARELALLLTTSGSTGSPKLVRQSAAGIAAHAQAIAAYLGLDARERPWLHLPMSYSYGLSVIHSHLVVGATVHLTRATVMEPAYWDGLAAAGATSIAGVPFHYAAIRRLGEARLEIPSLRTLTQAGGRLPPALVAHFAEWAARTGRRFVVMYGQTEAGPRIAWLPPEQAAAAPDAIGIPIPGVGIDLVDPDGRPVPAGETGEIRVTSPAVMLGYAHGPEDLARGDDQGGVLCTGDLARLGADGLYRIVGRSARLLKIFGLRVNLDEVEARLQAEGHPALAFGEDDRLRLYLEGEGNPGEARQRVVALFSLPPRGIEVRAGPVVPRAPSGKVAREALEAAWDAAGERARGAA